MDLPWHPDLASARLTSCSLRSCPTAALPSLPWSVLGRVRALHNSRGHYYKVWNVLHQPFPRTQERSKQPFCQTARLPWASPLGWKGSGRIGMGQLKAPILRDIWPTTVGPALRHDGGHTLDSFEPGQLELQPGPRVGHSAWLVPGASHCSPAVLSKACEARTAPLPDKRSVHFLGSQEA